MWRIGTSALNVKGHGRLRWLSGRSERARRALLAGISVIGALIVGVSIAAAASPLDGATFQGPSAHRRYTLDLIPVCYKKNYETRPCQKPSNVEVSFTTFPPHGSKCGGSYGYSFSDVTLTPFKIASNGSFSGTGAFSPGKLAQTFTVTGRFISKRTVKGTVSGNHGCGSDTYKLALPPQ
jgi:hypothetical protein